MRNHGYEGTRWRNRQREGWWVKENIKRAAEGQERKAGGWGKVGGEGSEPTTHETTETSVESHLGSKET